MDASEFERLEKPRKKRSRLMPFKEGIFQLKAKGYSDLQIKDWLAINGVDVSRQAVGQFIKGVHRKEKAILERSVSEVITLWPPKWPPNQ